MASHPVAVGRMSTLSFLLLVVLGCVAPRGTHAAETSFTLMTRDGIAEQMDTYTYTFARMPQGNHYIKWFEPKADMSVVHHMLLFGCDGDVSSTLHTRSGGMFSAGGGEPRGAVCSGGFGEPFIFGWGKNAPPLYLPEHTGFRVGDGGFKNLVLEVHYLQAQDPSASTQSGLVVHLEEGIPRRAMSVLAFATGFQLPPQNPKVLVPNTCCYSMARPLTAFAFRVHTHALGREVYLERMTAGRMTDTNAADPADGSGPVRLMGRDPQLPQLFEKLPDWGAPIVIRPGDKLRATCVFDTTERLTTTNAGWGHGDEMCNLYLMVHAEEPMYMSCSGGSEDGGKFRVDHSPDQQEDGGRDHPDPSAVSAYVVPPPPPGGRGASGVEGKPAARWPASIGQVGGLQVEEDGRHVWVFHRGSRIWTGESFSTGHRVQHDTPIEENTIFRVCTTTGRIVAAFGAGEHYMPHGLSLGPDGSVWVTDVGLHQVIRYNQTTGERIASFGQEKHPGRDGEGFCMPTQVAVAEDNSFWVADGYCNARVARFDADGNYVGQWGAANRRNAFEVPHSIALDSCGSHLVVADRENARVAVHNLDGTMEDEFDLSEHGKVYGVSLLRSEEKGMAGFYAICWPRVPGRPVRLVAHWINGRTRGGTTAHWDLPTVQVPHMISVLGGATGGTREWGRGVSVFVGETRPKVGDISVQRLWLGENFGAQYEIKPARGWVFRSDLYLDVPPLGEAGAAERAAEEQHKEEAKAKANGVGGGRGFESSGSSTGGGGGGGEENAPAGEGDEAEEEAAAKDGSYDAVKRQWAETATASSSSSSSPGGLATNYDVDADARSGVLARLSGSSVAGLIMVVVGTLMFCCLCCIPKPGSKSSDDAEDCISDAAALLGVDDMLDIVLGESSRRPAKYRRMQKELDL